MKLEPLSVRGLSATPIRCPQHPVDPGRRWRPGVFVAVAVGALAGCQEDPPPPPPPTALATAQATATVGGKGDPAAAMRPRSTQVPRVDPDTMKRYRVESCFFGSQGLRLLAAGYLESTKAGPPTADRQPSFGTYPNGVKPAKPAEKEKQAPGDEAEERRPRPPSVTQTVPFVRYLRYCAIAKSLTEPADPTLDAAMKSFNEYAAPLTQFIIQASRYFGTRQWEKDDFERGKFLHEKLSEALPKAEAQLATLVAPVNGFAAKAPAESPEKLDDAGLAAREATAKARALAVTFLPDAEGADRAALLEAAVAAQKTFADAVAKDEKSPYGKAVTPKLNAFIDAAKAAVEAGEPAPADETYMVMFTMADLVEANHRALNQLLRMRGDLKPGGKPMQVLSPQFRQRIRADPGALRARPIPSAK